MRSATVQQCLNSLWCYLNIFYPLLESFFWRIGFKGLLFKSMKYSKLGKKFITTITCKFLPVWFFSDPWWIVTRMLTVFAVWISWFKTVPAIVEGKWNSFWLRRALRRKENHCWYSETSWKKSNWYLCFMDKVIWNTSGREKMLKIVL